MFYLEFQLTIKKKNVIMKPVKQRKEWKNMRYLFTYYNTQEKEKYSAVAVERNMIFHDFNIR